MSTEWTSNDGWDFNFDYILNKMSIKPHQVPTLLKKNNNKKTVNCFHCRLLLLDLCLLKSEFLKPKAEYFPVSHVGSWLKFTEGELKKELESQNAVVTSSRLEDGEGELLLLKPWKQELSALRASSVPIYKRRKVKRGNKGGHLFFLAIAALLSWTQCH